MASLSVDLPPPQRLALAYAPVRARAATLAVLSLDQRMAAILRSRREPMVAQVRLAWWRETLALPPAEWPRGEPVLEALRAWRDPACLAALPSGWEALLSEDLTLDVIDEFAEARGRAFGCLAAELGVAARDEAAAAGAVWALADLAAHIGDGAEQRLAVERGRAHGPPGRLPASLRTLAVLAGLGAAALARGGGPLMAGPGSVLLALRIGLAGR